MLGRSFAFFRPSLRNLLVFALAIAVVGFGVARSSQSQFVPAQSAPDPVISGVAAEPGSQKAIFAGGCFWGMEAMFEHLKGVSNVVSGYSGGSAATAHYKVVSAGNTGHAESVEITYDPAQISYGELLKVFFTVAHDPTQLNQQGFDVGTQYRSAVFFTNDEQKQTAQTYIDQLNKAKIFYQPVATQVAPLQDFYAAEDYHQNFVEQHPHNFYVMMNERPKLARLQKQFPALYQQQ